MMAGTVIPFAIAVWRDRSARRRVALVAAAFTLVGLIFAVFSPKWYRSSVTVIPTRQQRSSALSSLMGGDLGGLALGLGMTEGAGIGADVQRIGAVFQSNDVSDAVIGKFDLKARYGEKSLEGAREKLWGHCDVRTLPKPSLVSLSCEDRDPRFVREVLGYFAEYGNQVFRRVSVSTASEQVKVLEKRVAELRAQAEAAAARMREFQEKHALVDLESQARAVVGTIASLNNQRIYKQLELDYARTFASGSEATARQLESQIAVVNEKLRTLEEGLSPGDAPPAKSGRAAGGMLPPALSVPKLRAEYEGLYRDRKVAETTLVFALERLESARADEARDTSTFLVLDPPTVPTRSARPKRVQILLGSVVLGLAAGMGLAWLRSRPRTRVEAARGKGERAA